ncbi:MAG: tRNA glutamyl-Q(34) synthetase GluQRS [Verrucomicrobia bacterium]|nr:tRNA glutamyl-Q(34) synthetase GluQRS [Verrucomicrobiota bacterium]
MSSGYRGRLAPSPTGYLHLGHAATFRLAQARARAAGGTLILRVEDLDRMRCRPEFGAAMLEDLHWAGLAWQEGPEVGGPCAPYRQSERSELYEKAFRQLAATGAIYPCACSRADVRRALAAPHADEPREAIYSGTCRPAELTPVADPALTGINWRFRTTLAEKIEFTDGRAGQQGFVVGRDFGDFLVWRKDGIPAYELAVVVDDAAMRITEVVRGEDLLESTARQLLLYRALALPPPAWFHAPLVRDAATGQRLAKRDGALSLRALRLAGKIPDELFADA